MHPEEKLSYLIKSLKLRGNDSHKFFENISMELTDPSLRKDAIKKISSCFAITQYGNFTNEEEKMLADIIEQFNMTG